jgi:hypothetical protein
LSEVADSRQELGYDVFEAENGERALKILDEFTANSLDEQDHQIDLATALGVEVPDGSGWCLSLRV